MRKPASREMISASVEVSFLHIQLIGQKFDFRKCTEFLLMLILTLQGLLQNQSLETILVCIVVLCFPHKNIVCIHLYDERDQTRQACVTGFGPFCYRTRKLVHRPQNIKSPNTQPNTDISEQFVSKL